MMAISLSTIPKQASMKVIDIGPYQEDTSMSRINPTDAPPHVWHRIAEDVNRERSEDDDRIEPHEVQELAEMIHCNKQSGADQSNYSDTAKLIAGLARAYGMDV